MATCRTSRPGDVYGYRVHGPYEPARRTPLQPQQAAAGSLCARPHRRAEVGPTPVSATRSAPKATTSASMSATARHSCPSASWWIRISTGRASRANAPCLGTRPSSTKLHVRGFTKLHPLVPQERRGTYAGLGTRQVVDYMRSLGVSSVELLPIHTFINDSQLLERGLTNYWGYNSIGFFAPDPRYASEPEQCLREFKEMVARFHDAGLEVILGCRLQPHRRGQRARADAVVQGHRQRRRTTGCCPMNKRYYINDTGTGNTLNLSHPAVIQMVTDSLRYWVNELHVDGFRFDLGTILAREPNGFDNQSGFLKACRQDPVLRTRQAHRRAVGLRAGRLPGRRLSSRLGGVERSLSRHDARFLEAARRRRVDWRNACAPRGTCTTIMGRRPWAASTSSPRTTASRSTTWCPTTRSTTKPTGRTTRTAATTIARGTAAPRAPPTIWRSMRCASARSAICWRRCCCRRARRCCSPATNSAAPSRATTTLTARTTKSAGSTGALLRDQYESWFSFVQKLTALRHHYPILRRNRFLTGAYDQELDVKDSAGSMPRATRCEPRTGRTCERCFGMLMDGRAQTNRHAPAWHRGDDADVFNAHTRTCHSRCRPARAADHGPGADTNDAGAEGAVDTPAARRLRGRALAGAVRAAADRVVKRVHRMPFGAEATAGRRPLSAVGAGSARDSRLLDERDELPLGDAGGRLARARHPAGASGHHAIASSCRTACASPIPLRAFNPTTSTGRAR